MSVSLLENFIHHKVVDDLETAICDKEFAWYWMPSSRYGHTNPDHTSEDFQFTHTMYYEDTVRCEVFPLAREVVFAFERETGMVVKNLYKLKANLLPRQELSPEGLAETVHVDLAGDGNYVTMVYYVMDSDGPTVVLSDDGEVEFMAHPKKGTAVYFPSNKLHRATPPSNNKRRIVLNIIMEIEK